MDTNRLNQGEMIAAVSAVLLFLIMFIFDWFGVEGFGRNAWQSFGFIDIILLITILVAIGGAVMTVNAQSVNTPVAISAITAALGILSVLLILFRIIDPPGGGDVDTGFGTVSVEIGRKIGVFLGLIAAGGIAYGGWMAMQAEGTSFQGEADRLQDRGPRGPGSPPAGPGGGRAATPPPSTTGEGPPPPRPSTEPPPG